MTNIVPILLLPDHVRPNSSNLPLLKAIQKVLNESYTATYCQHPEIFGTSHIRMADPAQLADIIGTQGFTLVLVIVTSEQSYDVVATCSVKDFGDGDIETYAQWSKNLSGAQWMNQRTATVDKGIKENLSKFELTAFAVSPHHQAMGLGARLLNEVKWLLAGRKFQRIAADTAPIAHRLGPSDDATWLVNGIDLDQLKQVMETQQPDNISQSITSPKLVLVAIRELGNEVYYQKRGFKTVWSGTVPVGMWDCLTECTMVYMEMVLD